MEIRDKAKIELPYVLYKIKRKLSNDFLYKRKELLNQATASKMVLQCWKCVIDTFEENHLI